MKNLIFTIALILNSTTYARDAGFLETKDFSQITNMVEKIHQQLDPKDLLIVFDLDNTLLKFEKDFGSEHWFLWQKGLLEKGETTLPAVTDTLENLLIVQSWIYEVIPMVAVTKEEVPWLSKLASLGGASIALTSRVLAVRNTTIREVKRNLINFSSSQNLLLDKSNDPFIPFDPNSPESSGLTYDDIKEFKLNKAREVLFDQGVFFTQGQHKGAMVKILLKLMQRKFKAVVFIDDRIGHVEGVQAMANSVNLEVYSVHFNFSENWSLPFFSKPKTEVEQDWCHLASDLNKNNFIEPEKRIYRTCME